MLHRTEVYRSPDEKGDHKQYGFVLALICVALVLVLALVLASVMFTPAPVGSGIGDEILFVGP